MRKEFEQNLEKIAVDENANGVLFFLDKTVLHADIFDSTSVFGHYFPKLLRGVSMEISGKKPSKETLTEAQAKYDLVEFLDGWEMVKKERHPGVGMGSELRAVDERYAGMQLEYNEHKIHSSIFNAKTMKRS
jgi:hypothetical protein